MEQGESDPIWTARIEGLRSEVSLVVDYSGDGGRGSNRGSVYGVRGDGVGGDGDSDGGTGVGNRVSAGGSGDKVVGMFITGRAVCVRASKSGVSDA